MPAPVAEPVTMYSTVTTLGLALSKPTTMLAEETLSKPLLVVLAKETTGVSSSVVVTLTVWSASAS